MAHSHSHTSSHLPEDNNARRLLYAFGVTAGFMLVEVIGGFLSGSLALVTITNPGASSDKELVLFRDSFGSSIAPLFVVAYKKITLIDIRYIHPDFLEQYMTFKDQDVLFLYSTLSLNHGEIFK